MPQKLDCRMGMGESGHQKPKVPARPRWPVDAVSHCTFAMLARNLNQALRKNRERIWTVSDRVVGHLDEC